MEVKQDIKFIKMDFLFGGKQITLEDGQTFGEFLKKQRNENKTNIQSGTDITEGTQEEGRTEEERETTKAI